MWRNDLPNKRQRSTPRKSSTNKRALSTRTRTSPSINTAMVATGQNPSISIGKAPSHPAPIPVYSDKWVKRVYEKALTETSASAGVVFSAGNFGIPGPFYVDKVQIWKLGTAGTGILTKFEQGTMTDLGTDSVEAHDYGNASNLPGVTFKVPLGHAKQVAASQSGLISANTIVTNTTLETFVCHMHVWVAI